jgi:hypothetical protein
MDGGTLGTAPKFRFGVGRAALGAGGQCLQIPRRILELNEISDPAPATLRAGQRQFWPTAPQVKSINKTFLGLSLAGVTLAVSGCLTGHHASAKADSHGSERGPWLHQEPWKDGAAGTTGSEPLPIVESEADD